MMLPTRSLHQSTSTKYYTYCMDMLAVDAVNGYNYQIEFHTVRSERLRQALNIYNTHTQLGDDTGRYV